MRLLEGMSLCSHSDPARTALRDKTCSSFVRAGALTPAWLLLLFLRSPLFRDCGFVHSLHPDDSNATSLRRTILESQTRRIRQHSCSIIFASAVVAVGLTTLSSGDSCGKRSFDSYSSWQRSSATKTGWRVGNVSNIPNVPMSISLLHETLSNKTDGV